MQISFTLTDAAIKAINDAYDVATQDKHILVQSSNNSGETVYEVMDLEAEELATLPDNFTLEIDGINIHILQSQITVFNGVTLDYRLVADSVEEVFIFSKK